MNTFVLKSLWNRRKQYVWLFAELVVITIVSWIVFDPAVIILYNAHQPMGYDVEQLCYGELRVSYDEEKDDPDILRAQLTTIDGIEDVYTCDMYSGITHRPTFLRHTASSLCLEVHLPKNFQDSILPIIKWC